MNIIGKWTPVNTRVDPKLWQEVKAAALRRGISTREFLERALRQQLQHPTEAEPS